MPAQPYARNQPVPVERIADALDRIAILLATINKDLKELVKTRSSSA
jgi:hypothetical protein